MKTNKIFTILLLGLMLINLASAMEIDNVREYDPVTREVTIYNSFLGIFKLDQVGKARLNTPLNVKVSPGYKKIAEFDLWAYEDYNDALKQFEFKDLKNGREKINREYDIKYKTYGDVEVDDYNLECVDIIVMNQSGFFNNSLCENIKTGSHIEQRVTWKKITPANLKKNDKLTIGVFTNVQVGDHIDWIPTIYGEKVPEWASWEASLDVDLISYWRMDETSGTTAEDSRGTYDGTANATGVMSTLEGKINTAANFSVGRVIINFTTFVGLESAPEATWSLWLNYTAATNPRPSIWNRNSYAAGMGFYIFDGLVYAHLGSGAGTYSVTDTIIPTGDWVYLTIAYNGSGITDDDKVKIYFNGTAQPLSHVGAIAAGLSSTTIAPVLGVDPAPSLGQFDGSIDEFAIWNRTLAGSEVLLLFNNDSGLPLPSGDQAPNITLNSPTVDINYTSPQNLSINFTAWDDVALSDVKLYVNGLLNQTNATGINNSDYIFPLNLGDGNFTIWGVATDNNSLTANSSSVIIIINTTATIEFLTPPTLVNNSNITQENIPIAVNVSTGNFKNITYLIVDVNTTEYEQFYTTEVYSINFTDLPDAHYHYNVTVCTTTNICSSTETRHINHDATPPVINIETPRGDLSSFIVGSNETLNVTFTDDSLDSCWYDYNGTNITIEGCITGVKNSTEFIYETGNNNLTVYANDTLGNIGSNFTSWEYTLIEISQTFVNQTMEGSTQDISALIRLQDGLTIATVILDYNGTLSAGTSAGSGDDILVLRSGMVTPNVDADENKTFHWVIVLSGGDTINLSEQTQEVLEVEMDNCSVFTSALFNLTVVDEKMQTIIPNSTVEIAINIFSEDGSTEVINFSEEFENINPIAVCLNINLSEGVSYSLDSIIRYEGVGYANEYYNVVNFLLDNDTEIQNITLYDLNISDSTDFQLTFTGDDYLPVENALISVERQYISENVFKTVELPKTDSNGQTVLHLVRNDVIYNILVTKDGEVLGRFSNIIAFCQDFTIGACSLPLNALSNTSLVFDYDDEIGLLFQESTQFDNTTRIASFAFSSVDGTPVLVGMSIERRDIFGNRTICNNSVLSASGSVSCVVGEEVTDTSLYSIISINGEDKIYSNVDLEKEAYGQNGYAMFFIFAILMVLMFSGSKTWTLIGVSLSYVFGVSLGFIIGGIAGVGSAGIFVLIISMVGIWQLNKGRKQ